MPYIIDTLLRGAVRCDRRVVSYIDYTYVASLSFGTNSRSMVSIERVAPRPATSSVDFAVLDGF